LQLKFLDVPATQACISAATSELLNEVVQCAAECLLGSFDWQGLTVSASAGTDIFGWSSGYNIVRNTRWNQPDCNGNSFFDAAAKPPPCPPPPPSPSPVALLRRQKQFADYLEQATVDAADLPVNFSLLVGERWDQFYASDCGGNDPTCDGTQNGLGRLLTDGFAANSTADALLELPADDPVAKLQAAYANNERCGG
jgi:hypothetical protein